MSGPRAEQRAAFETVGRRRMRRKGWICGIAAVLAAAALSASPAVSASKGCGARGYAYAGLQGADGASGVSATPAAVATPVVQKGHVAAWIGVGALGEGPEGHDEWLQVGLNTIAGNSAKLYYEVAQPWGLRYVELESGIPVGRRYRVEVLEMAGRRSIWRVWVDGRPASRPIWLPESHGRLTPMATAENYDGGAPTCNSYRYRFRGRALARSPGGGWAPFRMRTSQLMEDRGFRVVPAIGGGFVATANVADHVSGRPTSPGRATLNA